MNIDPRKYRLSPHFTLSDFLGNQSVYARGCGNNTDFTEGDMRLENAKALCYEALEPLLAQFGPLSVSYGLISPELSKRIVTYMDPLKPSHHLWTLGAAADIICHDWIAGKYTTIQDLYLPDTAIGSPIALAHAIDYLDIPYSRLITYSESPFLCLAVSAQEVVRDQPRKAFYENRYQGQARVKPEYLQYSTQSARSRALRMLQEQGLEHDWRGGGWPSYHGGGTRQLHHTRVSKYTMVSDFLFDLQSISNGAKNVPAMNLDAVQDSFAAAGLVYDWMIKALAVPRLSIVAGYVSHTNPYFDPANDWREGTIAFCVNLPEYAVLANHQQGVAFVTNGSFLKVHIDVEEVLTSDLYAND